MRAAFVYFASMTAQHFMPEMFSTSAPEIAIPILFILGLVLDTKQLFD